jgi:hypothetical protein
VKTPRQWSLRAAVVFALAPIAASCGFFPINNMSSVGTEVLERAPKPTPVDSAFDGCGEAGSQPDYVINRRKNRVDEGQYLPVPWKMLAQLPWPRRVGYRFRNQWTSSEMKEIARFEGAAVEVEGYVVDFRLIPPEPPNCYSTAPRSRDHHIWLSEGANGGKKQSIVIEITPRVRVSHPGWTEERLAALANTQVRVRVRGWLMFDQMHPESIGGTRITLWEVHPIMHLDWQSSRNKWISLDSLSPASDSAASGTGALQ